MTEQRKKRGTNIWALEVDCFPSKIHFVHQKTPLIISLQPQRKCLFIFVQNQGSNWTLFAVLDHPIQGFSTTGV